MQSEQKFPHPEGFQGSVRDGLKRAIALTAIGVYAPYLV